MIKLIVIISSVFISGSIYGIHCLISRSKKKKIKAKIIEQEFEHSKTNQNSNCVNFENICLNNEKYLAELYNYKRDTKGNTIRKINSSSCEKYKPTTGIEIVNKKPIVRSKVPLFK